MYGAAGRMVAGAAEDPGRCRQASTVIEENGGLAVGLGVCRSFWVGA